MNTLLISYDRENANRPQYIQLGNFIRNYGTWAKPLESLWLIRTNDDAANVRDRIRQIVGINDQVLVIDITRDNWASYNLSQEVVNWMQSNI